MKTSSRKPTASKSGRKPAPQKKKAPPVRTANLDRAIKDYEEALKVFARKDYAKAIHQFEAIIKEYPTEREVCDRARTYINISRAHAGGSQPKPRSADDFYYQGVVAANDGRLDEAAEWLEKAIKQDPGLDKAHYELAIVTGQRGDPAAAARHLARAIDLNRANRVHAANDPELDPLREDPEFMRLLGESPAAGAGA